MAILNNLIVHGAARFLNKIYANDIDIGNNMAITGKTTTNQLVVSSTTDIGGSTNSSTAPLVIGSSTGTHISLGNAEIMAKASATSTTDLKINTDGGKVYLSNGTQIYANNGTFHASTFTGSAIGTSNSSIASAYITTGNIATINSTTINSTTLNSDNAYIKYNLKASHYDLQTVSQLGGVFRVAPSILIPCTTTPSSNPKTTSITVTKSSNSATINIVDNSISNGDSQGDISTTIPYIGGVTWRSGAYVMCSGRIGDVVTGTMFGTITTINTSSRVLNLMITSGYNDLVNGIYSASQISDFTVVLYKTNENYPVGIELNSYGTSEGRTYVDVYGGTSNSPNVRIGNIGGLTYNGSTLANQWGIYTDNGYFSGKIVANGGTIGGWTIGDSYITTSSSRTSYDSTTNTGMTLSYNGSSGGIGAYNSATQNFTLSSDGILTAVGADIDGSITAREFLALDENGTEGASFDASGFIVKKGGITAGEAGESGFIYLSTEPYGENYPINNSTNIPDWKQIIGTKFGVRSDGTLYASNAHIADSIETESLRIGQWTTFDHRLKLCDGEYNISNDTSVQKGKVYFRRVEGGNVLYKIVTPSGNENPNTQNWYELTQTVPTDWLDHKDRYFIAGQYEDDYESINATYTVFGSRYYETTDTVPDSQKVYYQRSGSGTEASPYIYTAVNNPTGDPSQQSWYELQKLFYEKDMNSPQMVIGKKGDFAVTVDNTQITFWYAHQKVAFINGDRMEIPRSVMLEEMLIGEKKWSWREHEGNLQLKWIGD